MKIRLAAGALAVLGTVAAPLVAADRGPSRITKPGTSMLRYAPGPEEGESLAALEGYWAARVSYPTGRFDQRWLLKAADQDKSIESALPAGARSYQSTPDVPFALNPNAFTALGPKPEQASPWGGVSGRVNAIAIDPVDPTVAYIGPVGGGVWKATNCCTASTSWAPVTDNAVVNTTSIDDITIDPNDHNTVYAATGDLNFGSFAMGSAGVLKSTNAGASWQVLGESVFNPIYPPAATPTFPQYQAVGKVRVDPNNSSIVAAGTKTGVYFSYNGGTDWTGRPCLTDSFISQRHDVTGMLTRDLGGGATKLYVAIGTRGYATTVQPDLGNNGANGIYSTTIPASGCPASWTLLSTEASGWPHGTGGGIGCNPIGTANCPNPDANVVGRIDLAIAPSNPDVIYAEVQSINVQASCGARGCFLGLWKTINGGTTWTKQTAARNNNGCSGANGTSDSAQNWYNQGLAVSPTDSNLLYVNMIDVWRSTDGGTTIFDVACSYGSGSAAKTHPDQHPLAFVPGSTSTMLAGNDGGIWLITNASVGTPTFTSLNTSMNTIEFYSGDISADFANSASPIAAGGAQDNGSSSIGWSGSPTAGIWTLRNGGDGMFARIEPKAAQNVYMESQWGNMVKSLNGHAGTYTGASGPWGPGVATSVDRKSFVMPYEIDKYHCPTATCSHMIAGTYRVWETIAGGGPPAQNWYIAGPNLTKSDGVTGLADRAFINQLAYSYTDNTVAIAGTNDGNVWYGFNLGTGVAYPNPPLSANWVDVTGGNAILPNRPILDVTTSPTNPLVGYAAVGGFNENTILDGHVFQVTCTANCATAPWVDKSGNLPNIPVDSIAVNPKLPNQVFAGTDWGLYFTNNISAASPVWIRFDAGLPHVMIWDMSIDRGATTLAVFTRGRGAYAWPLPAVPTSVKVASFRATATRRGVTLTWRTASEIETLGFNVWRSDPSGKAVKLNRTLIAAKGRGAAGATYRLRDTRVREGVRYTYRLQTVAKDGARTWSARTTVRVSS